MDTKPTLKEAISQLNGIKVRRLFQEDPCVKGCAWFGKNPDSFWHVPANCLRVFFAIVLAPVFVFLTHAAGGKIEKLLEKVIWSLEFSDTPNALLFKSPTGETGQYEVTNFKPQWMLEVSFRNGQLPEFRQVPWTAELQKSQYTAISYPMDSAVQLFFQAGLRPFDPPPGNGKDWSLRDRKRISICVLFEFARARERRGRPEATEYIWLDEFCLTDERLVDEKVAKPLRKEELGRLPDIFRDAAQVCVFCHEVGCDHTGLRCLWGNRLYTIGEILHTPNVLTMTRIQDANGEIYTELVPKPGSTFRRQMEAKASQARLWHLSAILQHSSNSGAMPWQTAIHSLIVEAIRRDEAGGFLDHTLLAKGLNGLLPRRARLCDLKGVDGWADLAWLLELNQGFYNAASLAAVCNLADAHVPGHRWLGKPLAPKEGNERLEPRVTAFPVSLRHRDQREEPALCVISPEHVALQHKMRRDSAGLHSQEKMHPIRRLGRLGMAAFMLIAVAVGFGGGMTAAIGVVYLAFILYAILELLVGTIFVVRDGWVVLEDSIFGYDPHNALLRVDRDLGLNLTVWGQSQMAPNWETAPPNSNLAATRGITLFDLSCEVAVKAQVMGKVNDLVILAIHGNGLSCMLLNRPVKGARVKLMASKVGMTNLPPYVLCQSTSSGTVYVGDYPKIEQPKRHSQKQSMV